MNPAKPQATLNRGWYAVHTKPRQEAVAELNLTRQGFETYCPKIRVRKQVRARGKNTGGWTTAIEPLFPRYLFMRFDPAMDNSSPVRSTRGVVGLVRIGMELRAVPDPVIEYFIGQEDPNEQLRPTDAWPHQPGDKVTVLDGPLAGLEGVYQMQLAESRAMLLVELLGRFNEVQVDLHYIAPAGG